MVFYIRLDNEPEDAYKTNCNMTVLDCIELLKQIILNQDTDFLYPVLTDILDNVSLETIDKFRKTCDSVRHITNPEIKIKENVDHLDNNYKIWVKCKGIYGSYNTLFVLTHDNNRLSLAEWVGLNDNKYQEVLHKVIKDGGLTDPSNVLWDSLYEHINQDVLNHAYTASNYVNEYYKLQLISRGCKKMTRIVRKYGETKRDKSFKVNSDLIGFRVKVSEPSNILAIVEYIANQTTKHGGVYHIRNSIMDAEGYLTDIVQYIYAYLPCIGYVMEFQVGHPLSMYVFSVDSRIRDGEKLVDLWTNNFYKNVVDYIIYGLNYDYWDEIRKLYPNDTRDSNNDRNENIPTELMEILRKL
jgi:hypothetical protein